MKARTLAIGLVVSAVLVVSLIGITKMAKRSSGTDMNELSYFLGASEVALDWASKHTSLDLVTYGRGRTAAKQLFTTDKTFTSDQEEELMLFFQATVKSLAASYEAQK